jgi:hypothetical protein
MSKTALLPLLLLVGLFFGLMPASAQERATTRGLLYEARVTYPGVFENDRLYWTRDPEGNWRASGSPGYLDNVRCHAARAAFSLHGKWTGNLKRDGSCGTEAEPVEWFTGNFLNFLFDQAQQ